MNDNFIRAGLVVIILIVLFMFVTRSQEEIGCGSEPVAIDYNFGLPSTAYEQDLADWKQCIRDSGP